MEDKNRKERIVVIGGGFAGINMIQRLDKRKFDVTLVDRNNYHSFPPLFYQVASGGLEPGSISFPFRREMRRRRVKGVNYHMGEVERIDYTRRIVSTDDGDVPYDHLVIAAGTTNNFFGNDRLRERVFTLKSTSEGIRCRDEILDRLERASNTADKSERRRLLSFVVIGGGATGVEIAGAIGELKRYVISREYPELSADDMSITIVEGTDRLLGSMAPASSERAARYLSQLLVDIRLSTLMESYEGDTVAFKDGSTICAGMIIWTAGVTAESFEAVGPEPARGRGNRIVVDQQNRVPGFEGVYAIGDTAICECERYPRGLPQLAQVAIQQARLLAEQLNRGRFTKEFVYRDLGTMATIGRNRAVVELGRWKYGGWFAWLTWMFVHLMSLLGARNKLTVLINWTWAYFTYNSSLRLMFIPPRYPLIRHRRHKTP
ncbi:MAG: NAD(P)/FAD-dependent oxidoreductase [Clostridium sp.]|nr:NAD(P)/FAD-dependent oxidoreductase [Clostridium sp.]